MKDLPHRAMSETDNNKNHDRLIGYAIITLGAILVALIIFLVFNYRGFRRSAVNIRESSLFAFIHNHSPQTAADVSYVRPWMTFDYINKLFNLPTNYLQTQFMITNSHYPQLTVYSYARSIHEDPARTMSRLDQALQSYLSAAPSSTPQ